MCMLSGSFHILLVPDLPVVCVCVGRCAGGDCVISGVVDHVVCRPDQTEGWYK
jgi:acetyl-CoA carboxylase carboxyltransferase component